MRRLALVVVAASAAFAACTSTEDAPRDETTSPTDAGEGDAATPSKTDAGTDAASPDGGGCNALVNDAPEATTRTFASDAPAASGGAVASGRYHQTEVNLYDPGGTASAAAPSGLRGTLVIAGNVMDLVLDVGDGTDRTFTETFVASGTSFERTYTCPKPGPDLEAVYSVTGSTLVIYETDPGSGLVAANVFVKQ